MSSYTKLFQSIVTSTIWSEDDRTRIVWITLLALANQHGEVEASIPGLAKLAGVPVADTEKALEKLASPDPYSRTKDFEGRRIEAIDGGWRILNHAKYRDKASEADRREQGRLRQQRHRLSRSVTPASRAVTEPSAMSRHTEAEAEGDGDGDGVSGAGAPSSLPPEAQTWNAHEELPKVKSVGSGRLRQLRARRKDPFFMANWQAAIERVCQSDFCLGKNDRGWKADFDFFLKADTVAKISEGKFDNRTGNKLNATERPDHTQGF